MFLATTNIACKKDESTTNHEQEPAKKPVLIPMKIGNWWSYRYTYFNRDSTVSNTGIDTVEIRRDTTIQNTTWFAYNEVNLMTNKTDGVWWWEQGGSPALLLKYPAAPNETYHFLSVPWTVLDTNKAVIVPQGTHSCFVYSGGGATFHVAVNKGIIKRENILNGYLFFRAELLEMRLVQ